MVTATIDTATRALTWVRVVAARDSGRPILRTVLAEPARYVASDGWRLRVAAADTGAADRTLIAPAGDPDMTSYVHADKYPDVDRLWHADRVRGTIDLTAGGTAVLRAILERVHADGRAHSRRRDAYMLVRLTADTPGTLTVAARPIDAPGAPFEVYGTAPAVVAVQARATFGPVGFNHRFLCDALARALSLTIEYVDPRSPIRIVWPNGRRTELIMPVTLGS
jgi:hypothetical protein